nr:GNAT family N-acetyltransferase [Streptomyces alkaliphilus]
MTAEFAKCNLAGTKPPGDRWAPDYPLADEADAIRYFLSRGDRPGTPDFGVFGLYVVRDLPDRAAIGGIGFFGPPDDSGIVELGFGIVPSMRRRGMATSALRRALAIARDNGASTVRADTTVDNAASIRVMQKAGMTRTRSADGMVYFETDVTGGAALGCRGEDNPPAND